MVPEFNGVVECFSYYASVIQNPNNGNKLYEATEEALTHLAKACMNQPQESLSI